MSELLIHVSFCMLIHVKGGIHFNPFVIRHVMKRMDVRLSQSASGYGFIMFGCSMHELNVQLSMHANSPAQLRLHCAVSLVTCIQIVLISESNPNIVRLKIAT